MTTRPSGVPTARPSTSSATVPAKVRYGPSVPTARGYHQVSDIKGGIEGFGIAPKGDHFYYVQNVHVADIESKDVYPDLDKSKGLIYNDLMTRHWDYWDRGYYKHVFVGKFDGKEAHAGKDIMPGEAWTHRWPPTST